MPAIMTDFSGQTPFDSAGNNLDWSFNEEDARPDLAWLVSCDTAERLKNLPRGDRDDANAEQIDAAQFLLGL